MQTRDYQQILIGELEYRRSRNAGYSLRAYARDLKMSPSSLCEVMNRKKGVSQSKARKLGHRLRLSEDLLEVFVLSARAQHARASVDRESAARELEAIAQKPASEPLRTNTIVSWVTEAVLKLSERRDLEPDAARYAVLIDVPESSIKFAIRFLTRLGFPDSAPPSRAFLAFLGKGRRLNVEREQVIKRACMACENPGPTDAFFHEPILLEKKDLKRASRMISQCFEDIKRLERTTARSSLYYVSAQLFGLEKTKD